MWHYSWVYVDRLLLRLIRHQWQIAQKPNLGTHWVNWVYLQGCGCRNDSRTVTSPKPNPAWVTVHQSWSTLHRPQAAQQTGGYSLRGLWLLCLFQLGWSLLLPGSLDFLRGTLSRPYCLHTLWRGGALWICSVSGNFSSLWVLNCWVPLERPVS